MYSYLYIYIYIYIYIHIYIYICRFIFTHTCIYIYTHAHIHTHNLTYAHNHTHTPQPLHYAAWLGRTAAAHLLIQRGAAVDAQNRDLKTPLHLCAGNGKASIIRFDIYVYIYTCMCVCVCVCVLVRVGGVCQIHTRIYKCIYAYTSVFIVISMWVCT